MSETGKSPAQPGNSPVIKNTGFALKKAFCFNCLNGLSYIMTEVEMILSLRKVGKAMLKNNHLHRKCT